MSWLGDFFRDTSLNPVQGKVLGWLADRAVDGIEWLIDAVVEVVEWVLDAFFGVIEWLLSMGYKVISIFLPKAEEYAEEQIDKSQQLAGYIKTTIKNTPQEAREKNENLYANAWNVVRDLQGNVEKYTAERDLYRSLSDKGANEALVAVRNGQLDTSKTKLVNNTATSRDSRIAAEHGREGVKVYQH
ncbi:MAG: hypothetical protein II877_13080 [Synergistaceae bacterium]|nr:hypothetical protein [Synergistaceae bacterium]MBQ6972132.1 hypothetical protein [Synergistaceae bacterium]